MPAPLTYPGVYVQEIPSGVRTIAGVATSTALFIGSCADGPLNKPTSCLSYTEFVRNFSDDTAKSDLPRYVKLFYLNGGTTCYVMRVANGAKAAFITLKTEAGGPSLKLAACNPGRLGNNIRAAVTYDTDQPESTFNMEIFRWQTDANGNTTKASSEMWRNLSMNPTSPLYAEKFLTQNSALVTATDLTAKTSASATSLSGRPVAYGANFAAAWAAIIKPAACKFQLTVGNNRTVTVELSNVIAAAPATEVAFLPLVKAALDAALAPLPVPPSVIPTLVAAPPSVYGTPDSNKRLLFTCATGDVFISPAPSNDVAIPLMLGTAQGGLETGAWTAGRPAPTGMTIPPSTIVGSASPALDVFKPVDIASLSVGGASIPLTLQTRGSATDAIFLDAAVTTLNGNCDGVREKLRLIKKAVDDYAATNPGYPWTADVWGCRLIFRNINSADEAVGTLTAAAAWTGFAANKNLRYYALGSPNSLGFQTGGVPPGDDGIAPTALDYSAAYPIVDREVDLFNLMVLPSATGVDQTQLWGEASVFCLQRRALLLIDPPPTWSDPATAQSLVGNLDIGLVKDYAAVYYPRIVISENGLSVPLGPTGAMAGVMARTDAARGVWKAPAGIEADVRGVSGVESKLSDLENGLLNPKAINTIRLFSDSGVVAWGARTRFGQDSTPHDYKYIPVRRLALYLEESLYRGLKWVVFEPNDEPLWAQIRLNVGAFMHSMFRQGAFQGAKPSQAYFVRCDSETTTQDDRNKGIVNIWVGFAPLKPAEFVVLSLQQMAGQIEV